MNPLIGTCSWNYDSWIGLVYTKKSPTAAEYLKEYCQKYRTAEIDSWFDKIPRKEEALSYLNNVDSEFRFTCKVSNEISLTHKRNLDKSKELQVNPGFLSNEIFSRYLDEILPVLPRLDAVMLEFEYLNKEKMPSLDLFLHTLGRFVSGVPKNIPLAVEVRNKNYLNADYFHFLKENGIIHVFSEKIFMPHIYEVYERFGGLLENSAVIRLLGEDRAEIEKLANNRWDRILKPKDDLKPIGDMVRDLIERGFRVTVNVNNHYEGSSPRTIEKLIPLF